MTTVETPRPAGTSQEPIHTKSKMTWIRKHLITLEELELDVAVSERAKVLLVGVGAESACGRLKKNAERL